MGVLESEGLGRRAEGRDLVFDGEPVKGMEDRSHVVMGLGVGDKVGYRLLYLIAHWVTRRTVKKLPIFDFFFFFYI